MRQLPPTSEGSGHTGACLRLRRCSSFSAARSSGAAAAVAAGSRRLGSLDAAAACRPSRPGAAALSAPVALHGRAA